MNRRFSWRLSYPCLVASASLCVLEGVSFAREPAPAIAFTAATPALLAPGPTVAEARYGEPAPVPVVDLAPSGGAHDARPPWAPSGIVARSEGLTVVQALERLLAGMPVCHISRHPLDGLRASEHACPLLFADATGILDGMAPDPAGDVLGKAESGPGFYVF